MNKPDISSKLVRWIRLCNSADFTNFLSFHVDESHLGWISRKHLERFQAEPELFLITENKITFHPQFCSPEDRSQALAPLLKKWQEKGWIHGWRGEFYRASVDFHQQPEFVLERSASQLFGLNNYGVHINGMVRKAEGLFMWIAKRNPSRPRYPGKLDHIVAGGLTAGETARQTMIRECAEEAAIPENLAQTARSTGLITLCMEEDDCLKRDVIFTYDLELPESFQPQNADGEVEEFFLWPVEKVMQTLAETDKIKLNCNLVMIDFLVRHGFLTPEDQFYSEIVSGLKQGTIPFSQT